MWIMFYFRKFAKYKRDSENRCPFFSIRSNMMLLVIHHVHKLRDKLSQADCTLYSRPIYSDIVGYKLCAFDTAQLALTGGRSNPPTGSWRG